MHIIKIDIKFERNVLIMEFMRYSFLFLVIAGCTSVGFLLSRIFSDRLEDLKNLHTFLNILQNKIKFTHLPLNEIFEQIGEMNTKTKIKRIFLKCSNKLKDMNMEKAWAEAIEEEVFFLNLNNEDIDTLISLGHTLGKSDIEGQISEIEEFKERLNVQIREAELQKNKNSKLYKSLGTIVGLVIVILLF